MALANDIALYALGYWTHEQHPFRINSICLNTKQRKSPCRACTDICPQGIVLHSGKAVWNGCTNCNLCVTACPTAAINQSSSSFEHIRSLILEGNAPISFACERVEEGSDVRCTCLATVPWDLAAAAALRVGVVLKAEACKTCPYQSSVSRVKKLVHDLRSFLGKDAFSQCVYMHDQPGMQRSAGDDKRFAFNKIAGSVAQASEQALEGSQTPTMSCYRALLLDVLAQAQEQGTPYDVTWPVLIEDGNCLACEICTKMCPHKALELQVPGYTDRNGKGVSADSDNPEASGAEDDASANQGQMLFHNASKCTQCGLCYVSCPNENLGGWDSVSTTTVPAIKAFPLHVALCEKCGRPFKPKDEEEAMCQLCNRPKFAPGHK